MVKEVFYWIFNMSITAAVAGMVVMLIRLVRKIPRRVVVLLWIVPYLRMVVPVGMNSPYSFMTLLSHLSTKTVEVYQVSENIRISMANSVGAADSYFPVAYKVNVLDWVFMAASAVWIIVAIAVVLVLMALYFVGMRDIRGVSHLRENIYLSDKISSPAVYGIMRPKIILPLAYAEKDTTYVIMHEKAHIRHGDNLWRTAAFLVTAVHWFNPFAWIFLKLFLADLELACDERVLLRCGKEQARDYARSLLECKAGKSLFASAFGGAGLRARVENILSFKIMTWGSLVGFLALVGTIFFTLLTNAE